MTSDDYRLNSVLYSELFFESSRMQQALNIVRFSIDMNTDVCVLFKIRRKVYTINTVEFLSCRNRVSPKNKIIYQFKINLFEHIFFRINGILYVLKCHCVPLLCLEQSQ